MMNQGNLALANDQEQAMMFHFPDAAVSADFTSEDLAEDSDGIRLSFPRAKISGGGAIMFELPGEDSSKPEYVDRLEGVILFNHASNAYWVGDVTDEDNTPLCKSVDGKTGYGDPGGPCASCSLNRFGSGEDGKAKACKNQRCLYFLRDGEFIPMVLFLPPTSLKAFNQFMSAAFLYRGRASYGSLVELTLHREDKPSPHAVVDFRKIRDFTGRELASAKAFANAFRNQAKAMLQEQIEAMVDQQDDGCDYDGFDQKGKGDGFVIEDGARSREVRDELPL